MKLISQGKKSISPLTRMIQEKAAALGITTNAALAKRAGVDPSVTWRLLNGGTQISVVNIFKILKSIDLLNFVSISQVRYGIMESDVGYHPEDNSFLQEQLNNYRELMLEYKHKALHYKEKYENLKASCQKSQSAVETQPAMASDVPGTTSSDNSRQRRKTSEPEGL